MQKHERSVKSPPMTDLSADMNMYLVAAKTRK